MDGTVLVLNTGSSSVKFAVYRAGDGPTDAVLHGRVEEIGRAAHLIVAGADGVRLVDRPLDPPTADHATAFEAVVAWVSEHMAGTQVGRLLGAGHRVVHGGLDFAEPVLVDDAVLERLEALVPLAPLHQPHNLAGIRAMRARHPGLPQVACFDTAFHRGRPAGADLFALPRRLFEAGIRRYGFHGLSYEHVSRRLTALEPGVAGGRVVIAHLGAGASLCATVAGRSVDSTMGFTALDGLPMGTRCGALDPGVVLHLIERMDMTPAEVERVLYRESGLLGLSGISSDVRELEASAAPEAAMALDHFAMRIARETASLAIAMGGLDGLVFTAGIGENSVRVRKAVCARLAPLRVRLDEAANQRADLRLSAADSAVAVLMVPTDEEGMIARHTLACLRSGSLGDAA